MTEGRHTCPNLQVRGYVPIRKKKREQTDGGRGRGKERERERVGNDYNGFHHINDINYSKQS